MIAGKRTIKDGSSFERFFPRASGEDIVENKNALLSDTIRGMKRMIGETLWQSKKIAAHLRAESVRKTCKNIWEFCYHHIQYEKDEFGKEQIRSPRRSWHDRERGIDCDCFTVLICSMLSNLNIPYVMRLWRNSEAHFEHVYPVAYTPKGKEVIIDCVIDAFDQQAPYTEIKDIEMELHFLDGVNQERHNEFGDKIFYETDLPIDALDLGLDESILEQEGISGLKDWLKRRKEKSQQRKETRQQKREERKTLPLKDRIRERVRNFGSKLNRVNPVTSLVRAGVLASMKLNILQIASKMRFAYWTDQQANRANMNMIKFGQLKAIRSKIEKIYKTLGGDINALKKSVLTGRGNRDRMVALNGLGSVHIPSEFDDIRSILGEDIIAADLSESGILDTGINGLGAISLSAIIAAAAPFIAKIASMFKKLGGFFKKGSKQASRFLLAENAEKREDRSRPFSAQKIKELLSKGTNSELPADPEANFSEDDPFSDDFLPDASTESSGNKNFPESFTEGDDDPFSDPEDERKKAGKSTKPWYKNPWIIGGSVLGVSLLAFIGWKLAKPKSKPVNGLQGVKTKAKPKRKPKSGTRSKKRVTAKKPAAGKTTKRKTAVKKKSTRRKPTTKRRSTRIKTIQLG